ncbi:MAG: hypothetical protein AAF517_25025, partial [Planctomycetota bacterium]
AQAMAQDLSRFARGEPIEAEPESRWLRAQRRLRQNRVRILSACACVAVAAIVIWTAIARSRAERERIDAVFPDALTTAVGRLDSGTWILNMSSPPLSVPGVDFRIFESRDFHDVTEIGGRSAIHDAIAELDALAKTKPEAPEPYYHIARAHLSLDDAPTAKRFASQALSVDSEFAAASVLVSRVDNPHWTPDAEQTNWVKLWHRAATLASQGKRRAADEAYTDVVRLFELEGAPYTGALLDCYLRRADVRLRLGSFDLAEEDCLLARSLNPLAHAPDLLLGRVYLAAKKPVPAKHAFVRLTNKFPNLSVLPFWIVSIYLGRDLAYLDDALEWANRVRTAALRERLLTYLYLRLSRWDDAIQASRRAVEAAPNGVIELQLLADALLKGIPNRTERRELQAELVEVCERLTAFTESDPHSRFLIRMSRELLHATTDPDHPVTSRMESLASTLRLRTRKRGTLVDSLGDELDTTERMPLAWRNVRSCCAAAAERDDSGLLIRRETDRALSAWFVSDEIFHGDVSCSAEIDVGDRRAGVDLHIDLGSASLFFGGVRADGTCELGRLEFGKVGQLETKENAIDASRTLHVELASHGDRIEFRAWTKGSPRPERPVLVLNDQDPTKFIGAAGFSTTSRPARFRRVKIVE